MVPGKEGPQRPFGLTGACFSDGRYAYRQFRPRGRHIDGLIKLAVLFAFTAVAEIIGCYLPWLVIKRHESTRLLVPAAVSLALFAWLLTLHPMVAGRTYAAYGGMYIAVALLWLRFDDGVALTRWDLVGAGIALTGMAVIALQPSTAD